MIRATVWAVVVVATGLRALADLLGIHLDRDMSAKVYAVRRESVQQ